MKLSSISQNHRKYGWAVMLAIPVLYFAGCSKAPEAPTAAQQGRAVDAQVQAIQNNPNMPEGAKLQAINGLKSQQERK